MCNILNNDNFFSNLQRKRGQRYTNCILNMKSQTKQQIKVGDKVTFDNDQIEVFKAETNLDNKEIQQYRKLVLAGIDQVGIVKEPGAAMTTVSYPDGWELPIPTKYLVVLPEV